jgi:hypothetical protein
MKPKWICIKDFPQELFVIETDAYKVGKTFNKWTYIIFLLSYLEGYNINDYITTLAEWRDKQIDSVLNDE